MTLGAGIGDPTLAMHSGHITPAHKPTWSAMERMPEQT